jgi:sulfur-carrier protein
MRIKVRLFATLRQYRPGCGIGQTFELDLPDGATIEAAVDTIGIPRDSTKTVFVNGYVCEPGHSLSDGDEVGMFPPVAGG